MAASRIISVATVMVVLSLTGCSDRLPSSAEQALLQRLGATKISSVHELRQRTVNGFDYLGLFATYEVPSGFEAFYHPKIILRKKHSDRDWSNADLFNIGTKSLESVFQLPEPEFIAALHPW
jgi:hypothetical protein